MRNPGLPIELLKAVSHPLIVVSSTFDTLYQSDRAASFLGTNNTGVPIESILAVIPEGQQGDRSVLGDLLHRTIVSKQKTVVTDCSILPLLGNTQAFQSGTIEITPFVDKHNVVYQLLLQIHSDSVLVKTQQALEQTLQLVDNIERVSECGSWELNLVTNQLSWSDGVFILCGYEPKEFAVTLEVGLNVIHPDDRDLAVNALQETLQTGKEYYIRKRLLTKNGTVKHVISRATVFTDESGQPIKLVGVFIDRSREQEYQEELLLQQTNEDTLINSTDDLVWSVDDTFHIISCNTSFTTMVQRMTGINIGRGDYALHAAYSAEHLAKWQHYYERGLGGEKFTVKEETVDAEGKLIHCSFISITPLFDHLQKIRGVACFGKDITAETKANKTLAELNFELQNILSSSVDIICSFNTNGEFVNINAASYKVWGYHPEELLHTPFKRILHPDDVDRSNEIALEVLKGKDVTDFENRYIHKNGTIVPMVWSARWDPNSQLMFCVAKDATERNKAEQSLKESEKRFRSLVENSAGAIGILTPEGDALYASPSIQHVIGYTEQEALSLNLYELTHPDDEEKVRQKLSESINQPNVPIQNLVCRVMHKDGNWRWIAATFTNLIHEPNIGGIVNNFRDVTARVNDELQLKLLIDNTEEGFILMDKNLHIVSFNRQFETLYKKYFNMSVEKGKSILDYAQPDRKQIVKAIYERVLKGAHEVSEIEVSVPADGIRVFKLAFKPAINHAGAIEGAFVSTLDITETKRIEKQTKEYQSFIETAFENLPIGIAVNRTEDNAAILMNKNFADIYGWPKEDLKDVSSFFEKVYPDEQYRKLISERVMEDLKSGDPNRMNWEGVIITTQSGEERIVNAKNIPVLDQKLMISTVIDVTEREAHLQRIKDSERKLLSAQHLVKLGNWQLDFEDGSFDWSDEVYNIWGLDRELVKPNFDSFLASIHPDDRSLFDSEKDAVINGQKQLDFEHRIVLPDGTIKWVHEKASLIKDKSGNNKTLEGSVQDITVEKMLSISLEESNQRYHYATQATFDAIWDWDIVKNTIYRGENYQFIFGYSKEALIASSASWVDHIHPDDREAIVQSITQAIEGNQSKWSGEYKYEQHDGTYAYVSDRGIIVRDRNGKATRMVGAMQDITKQKKEEARLKLLESVITNTNDAVLITEAEPVDEPGPRIIYVNEAFTRMTGYTPEEVIGKSPRLLQGPESDQAELKKLSAALRNWESYEMTTVNYKKSGEPFWIHFAITPVADAKGWYTHWIAVERDVTKIKQAEQDLQKAYADKLEYIRNIEEKNERLSEIAWIQSHIVRAPLARIMGIVDALLSDAADPDERKVLLHYLSVSAEELDQIIREIAAKSAETRL